MLGFIRRLFSALWRAADGIRKALHLLLMLLLFMLITSLFLPDVQPIADKSALVIRPTALVEQLSGDPFDRGMAELLGEQQAQTLVRDIVDGLRFAAEDDRITVVILDLRGMPGAGMSKLQRVGAELRAFRESGKPVIAYGDFFSQGAYYLAAQADEVYLHGQGMLLLPGFGAYSNYYRDAIERLEVEWNVFRAGDFKSAVEPYERNDMSDLTRASLSRVLGRLWSAYAEGIATARGVAQDSISSLQAGYAEAISATTSGAAGVAAELGFVDGLASRKQFTEHVREHAAADADSPLGFRATFLGDYVAQMRVLEAGEAKPSQVAVVVASGQILTGFQSPGTVGGESTAALLRKARLDDKVKAVVLRIDSPGGVAFSAELIRDEVLALKEAGKPVVASMSSVAASGGYLIAMSADRILASETTITGSIGVFLTFPTFEDTLGKVGVYTDGVGTSSLAGAFRADRSANPDVRRLMQAIVDDEYRRFVANVAEARNLTVEAVDRVAQGQIWTGREALDNGLVDAIGEIEQAVTTAAELALLQDGSYDVRYIEPELGPAETLALQLFSRVQGIGLDLASLAGGRSALERLAVQLEKQLAPLASRLEARGTYAHCLCAFSTD